MSEWISVSDRLPEEYIDRVLVARHTGSTCPAVMAAFYNGEDFIATSICGNSAFIEPTHWAYMPPPPEQTA